MTVPVRARVPKKAKAEAEKMLGRMGLSVGDAVRMMRHEVRERRQLPWQPGAPVEVPLLPDLEVRGEAIAALRPGAERVNR